MTIVYLLPVVLSFVVLAAHFLRGMSVMLISICLLAPLLLLVRRRWIPWIIQIMLLLGALEWLATMVALINQRQADGRDWHRMAVILGSVMLFTAASGLVFALPRLRRRYARTS
jgi:hypothetical protein